MTTEPRLAPLADAIEAALTAWKPECSFPPGCSREDCFKSQHADAECRARSEYIAAKISRAAKEYAEPFCIGWIVGNGAQDKFRMWGDCGPEWTADRNKALQFARREDGEAFAREDEDAWLIIPLYGRDPQARIDELIVSNNELLARARAAEADVALVRAEIATMGERVEAMNAERT